MANLAHLQIDDAASRWLKDRQLSEAAKVAYAGEVTRLALYSASRRVVNLCDLRQRHWIEYVGSLTEPRDYLSPPRKALKPGSALQAIRITRGFLTYCAQQGWIDWEPRDQPIDRPAKPSSKTTATLPKLVRQIVLGNVEAENEREARRNFVTALSFWGGLTPKELAELQVRHQRRNGERLKCPLRETDVELPAPVAGLWRQYRDHRARYSDVKPSSPLIVGLRSHAAVSPWAIWSILRDGGVAAALSTRQLRAGYVSVATADAEREIEVARRQIGKISRSPSLVARKAIPMEARRVNELALQRLEV
jgi:site-specific recombinase XerD